MRFLLTALAVLLVAPAAPAQEAEPMRRGYAFDIPRVLAEQRLFGIAHGVALLAAACHELPAFAARTDEAYGAWRAQQQVAIDLAAAGLARYHFGAAASAADWRAIAGALNLKDRLDPMPEAAELEAACATLPEALAQPRYALAERLRLEELMAQVVAAVEVETYGRHCRERVPPEARAVHEARYDNWRELNMPQFDQAKAALAADWPADAPEARFDDWLTAQRRDLRVQAGAAECLEFSETLKQPRAALRNAFNPPPK